MGEGKPARNPRNESITAIAFADGRVLVAGISNEAFSSTLRVIPFSLSTVDRGTGEENDHGAHGKFRTRVPVRTFVPFKVGGDSLLRAAYPCTPRVQFALNDLKPGAKIMGKTLAEFGNGHRPLDIIVYPKDGKDDRHMANNARGVIKVAGEQITGASSITAKVAETEGLKGEKFEWAGITQLDRIDGKFAFAVRVGPNTLRRAGRHGRGPADGRHLAGRVRRPDSFRAAVSARPRRAWPRRVWRARGGAPDFVFRSAGRPDAAVDHGIARVSVGRGIAQEPAQVLRAVLGADEPGEHGGTGARPRCGRPRD